ncbi:YheC/YheD family protein [Cytobacillus spongiae]|uniref:YheC/YheD family endospore coat-associated protein n=1 Tax=Cytobacillus spongiae TaxID=2901381 RepID=UPI001F1B7AAC|nr:YheC/YheD family protein [Cytobacillus spongiae]UII56855.1 YheC/YheD family protein [Cytobacillus spongiae]
MLSLGFMTLDKTSEQTYFTEIAKRSHSFGIICYRFVPTNINPVTQQITGEQFDHREHRWVSCEFPLPSILYDRCFYREDTHSRQCKTIVSWLKKRKDLKFLGYGLPNKLDIFQALSHSSLAPYLPHSIEVNAGEQLLELLLNCNPILLKPTSGSQGNGIFLVEKQQDGFHVRTDKREKQITHTFADQETLVKWGNQLVRKREYLMQPFLYLSNQENRPYDIRSFLQKDQDGIWRLIGRGIRTGSEGGIISNISAGGSISDFENWLSQFSISMQHYLVEELQDIYNKLPHLLESSFFPLFEIGLDIGVANDGAIWILDVNSKPGRKVVISTKLDEKEALYIAPLLYAKKIVNQNWIERRTVHEKKIPN